MWARPEKRYKDVVRPKGNSRMLGRSRPGRVTGEREMASSDDVRDLFAPPRVLAADGGEPGELLLRSAGELGEYPVTVLHSLREWAGIAPNIL